MRYLAPLLIAALLLAACRAPADEALAPAGIFVSTGTASATPTATPTFTPAPTRTPLPPHPLTIDYLRQQEYAASDLVIEQSLDDGGNYYRYIASYYSEGLKQYGLLTIPFGQRPATGWPVIVFNHGYIDPDVYRTAERYVNYIDGFARSGYIVFSPDYRGHDQSGGRASGAYGGPGYTVDVLNAVAALKAFEDADPDRIGMWGHSMGGFITLRAMVVDTDIKAGVIWAGVVASYAEMYTSGERPRFGSWGVAASIGPPQVDPDFWASISANSYLRDLSGPLQLHHGTGDGSVPPSYSQILTEEARAAGKTVELHFYEGDDHNLASYFSTALARSIAFFDQYVKGEQ